MARTILFLFTLAAAQVCAHAAAPNLFTYQGRLKEGGMPVTGNREVEIWLCPAESGGPACTTTGPQPVAVANGLFRSTFSLPGGFDLGSGAWWLEIEIGGATLSPRERLTSNAYAMYAATAAYAEGLTAAPGSAGVYISSNLYVAGGAFTVGSRLQVSTHGTTAVGDFSGISVDTNTAMHVVGRTADLQPGIEDGRVAFYADARSSGSGPEDILAASNNEVTSDGADSAALAVAVRAKIRRENAGAGVIGQVYGLMVDDLSNSGGTLTDTYGVYIGDQTDGVQTNGAYALYSSDINARNYFGGFVGISSAAPVAALAISSAAGSADRMLVISTGTSEIFSVKGNGEVYTAGKFIGDGSLLFNLPAAGGGLSKNGDTMTGPLVMSASSITVLNAEAMRFGNDGRLVWGPQSEPSDTYLTMQRGGGYFKVIQLGGEAMALTNGNLSVAGELGVAGSSFTVGGSTLAVRYGSVGVGSAAPRAKLDVVQADIAASSYTLVMSTSPESYHLVLSTNGWLGLGQRMPMGQFHLSGGDGNTGVIIEHNSDSTDPWTGPWSAYLRARGGMNAQAIVQENDALGALAFMGYDGFNSSEGPFRHAAGIKAFVDGIPGAGGADMPGRLEFFTTPDGAGEGLRRLVIRGDGSVGVSTGSPQARLDVLAGGSAQTDMAQIWRAGDGVVKGSMSATGVLMAAKFVGDGSGLSNISVAGDGLGDHNAAQRLNMGTFAVWSSSAVTARYYEIAGSTVLAVLPGDKSLGVGFQAGRVSRGNENTFVGYNAGADNSTGGANTIVGAQSGTANSNGNNNTFVGAYSGSQNSGGNRNSFYGVSSGFSNDTGSDNAFYGPESGRNNTGGNYNTALGAEAMKGTAGNPISGVTAVGYQAGRELTTGGYNTLIGHQAGDALTTGTGNIVIGSGQDAYSPSGSDTLNIGGVLFGDLAARTVGISTRVPQAALDVVSTGTAQTEFAQVWRASDGVVKGSMSATGVLMAARFVGDGSGLTGLPTGDDLGDHTATQDLQMGAFNINSAAQLTVSTVTGPLNSYVYFNQNIAVPSSSLVVGRGAATAGYPLSVYGDSGGIAPVLHLENKTNGSGSGIGVLFSASGAGWGSLNVVDESASIGSTSMRFATFSGEVLRLHGARAGIGSTTPDQKLTVAGNISQTGVLISSGAGSSYFAGSIGINTTNPNYRLDVQGGYVNASGGLCIGDNCKSSWASVDNLGDHTATTNLQMSHKSVLNVASVTIGGLGLQIATDLTSTGNGIFISTAGSIWTLGFGNGSAAPNGRGVGAVDLQTFRSLATQVSGGKYSVIAGGNNNTAGGEGSVVAGGGTNNATGTYPTVGGGQANTANSTYATVSGGGANAATGYAATVSGGQGNIAKGNYTSVSGYGGSAMANYATIAGGRNNSATGEASWAAGYMSSSTASGAFTWADGEGVATQNAVQDRTLFKNRGGFLVTGSTNTNMTASVNRGVFVSGDGLLGVSTGAPKAALDVVAKAGNDNVQIWRNSSGVAVATMTADGTLQAKAPITMVPGPFSNTLATEETLLSYGLPANTLNMNGKGLRISAWGSAGPAVGSKTIRLRFGGMTGTVLVSNTSNSSPLSENWHYEAKVYRTGANTQKFVATGVVGSIFENVILGTAAETETATIQVVLTSDLATAGEIVAEGMTVELIN